jgi:hypothetical protein
METYVKSNKQSPLFAEFCELEWQVQFKCCYNTLKQDFVPLEVVFLNNSYKIFTEI